MSQKPENLPVTLNALSDTLYLNVISESIVKSCTYYWKVSCQSSSGVHETSDDSPVSVIAKKLLMRWKAETGTGSFSSRPKKSAIQKSDTHWRQNYPASANRNKIHTYKYQTVGMTHSFCDQDPLLLLREPSGRRLTRRPAQLWHHDALRT